MKVYFWDFHGVLEEGSEKTLVAAINELRRRNSMFPDVTEEELVGYFGPSLPEVLNRFFPGQDTKSLSRKIGDLAVAYTGQMMRPREGAIITLRTIRERGDLNYLVSSADGEDVSRQLALLGMESHLHGVHTYLLNGYSDTDSIEEFKAGIILNTGVVATRRHYSKTPDGILLIGDTETDIRSARLARQMVSEAQPPVDIPVYGVLFDPNSRNSHVQADYRVRRLQDVLSI